LTFDRQTARIVVDSYGDVLADRSAPMTPAAWDQVSASYPRVREVVVTEPELGCTGGGTGFALTVADGGTVSYAVSAMACGGTNSDADRIVAEWVGPVRSLFEPMDRLAPEG